MDTPHRFHETTIALGLAWFLGPFTGALVGFYLGTIWATSTAVDLQNRDIQFGLMTGGIGLLLGVAFAIVVTLTYPKRVERDLRELEAHEAHGERHPH
jgi:hypothetical protein